MDPLGSYLWNKLTPNCGDVGLLAPPESVQPVWMNKGAERARSSSTIHQCGRMEKIVGLVKGRMGYRGCRLPNVAFCSCNWHPTLMEQFGRDGGPTTVE